ncbi:MAG: alpha/beta hydrolase [Actinomycetota bacterium]|nr:alpha/beta hydrolase [Actinomycetota bacterium]
MRSAQRATWSSTFTEVDGLRVHARTRRTRGDDPVVFAHGLLVSSRYMQPTAAEIPEDVEVWGPDMPGWGKSDNPPHILDVPELGRWLGRWIEVHGLHDVVLVANSFGCQYAADLAAHDASRIKALVLAGPTMDPARRTAVRQAARWALNGAHEPPALFGVIARDLLDFGLLRLAVTYRHGLRDAIEDKLPRIPVPTIVMRGGRDTLVTQRWAEEAAGLLPDGRLVVVDGAAHTLNFNSPEAVANVVRSLRGDA